MKTIPSLQTCGRWILNIPKQIWWSRKAWTILILIIFIQISILLYKKNGTMGINDGYALRWIPRIIARDNTEKRVGDLRPGDLRPGDSGLGNSLFGDFDTAGDVTTFCCDLPVNRSKYHGHNLLCDPVFKFDKNFKNPCWYENSELKCLPYFFLIGVKKTSTTDLFSRISRHPDYAKWGGKEAQFFARKRFSSATNDDIYTYVERFKDAAKTIQLQMDEHGQNIKSITGDFSPSNLHLNSHWQNLPENEGLEQPRYVILDYIKHFIPQTKIIISFRDPVDRLYSDYYHEYGVLRPKNTPSPHQFHDVVTLGIQLYNRCFKQHSLRHCVYDATIYDTTKIHMQLGIYHVYWEELLRVFPRDRILIVQSKDHNGNFTLTKVFNFLGMSALHDEDMQRIINLSMSYTRRTRFKVCGPMLNITRELLEEFYRPFNVRMAQITGDDTFLFKRGSP